MAGAKIHKRWNIDSIDSHTAAHSERGARRHGIKIGGGNQVMFFTFAILSQIRLDFSCACFRESTNTHGPSHRRTQKESSRGLNERASECTRGILLSLPAALELEGRLTTHSFPPLRLFDCDVFSLSLAPAPVCSPLAKPQKNPLSPSSFVIERPSSVFSQFPAQ